jgi:hypothetical protein
MILSTPASFKILSLKLWYYLNWSDVQWLGRGHDIFFHIINAIVSYVIWTELLDACCFYSPAIWFISWLGRYCLCTLCISSKPSINLQPLNSILVSALEWRVRKQPNILLENKYSERGWKNQILKHQWCMLRRGGIKMLIFNTVFSQDIVGKM